MVTRTWAGLIGGELGERISTGKGLPTLRMAGQGEGRWKVRAPGVQGNVGVGEEMGGGVEEGMGVSDGAGVPVGEGEIVAVKDWVEERVKVGVKVIVLVGLAEGV